MIPGGYNARDLRTSRRQPAYNCTTIYPQVYAIYGLQVIRKFTVRPDGSVRMDNVGDGSSTDPGPSYGNNHQGYLRDHDLQPIPP